MKYTEILKKYDEKEIQPFEDLLWMSNRITEYDKYDEHEEWFHEKIDYTNPNPKTWIGILIAIGSSVFGFLAGIMFWFIIF